MPRVLTLRLWTGNFPLLEMFLIQEAVQAFILQLPLLPCSSCFPMTTWSQSGGNMENSICSSPPILGGDWSSLASLPPWAPQTEHPNVRSGQGEGAPTLPLNLQEGQEQLSLMPSCDWGNCGLGKAWGAFPCHLTLTRTGNTWPAAAPKVFTRPGWPWSGEGVGSTSQPSNSSWYLGSIKQWWSVQVLVLPRETLSG